jgi:alginate O-acetyltransferase complex protein AlgJ
MPVPLKPGVHPEHLAGGFEASAGVLQNRSYAGLLDDLRREGVLVFDSSPALAAAPGVAPLYLQTDTHWRPETMEGIVDQLAAFIRANVTLPDAVAPDGRVERVEVQNTGDTARMLDLPEGSLQFPPESVWLRRILGADGTLWASTRGADVLLLGDSFSNIYSLASLEWGTSAGLAEQLSYALGRPLDRIIQNDEGAFATREILLRDPGRIDGTRVVIWQFAARELAFGDWKVLPLR